MMRPVAVWIQAMRPQTLIASISPVFIGISLSLSAGFFDFWTFLFTILCAIAIQTGTNFTNDYFDFIKGADTSERKGPLRVTQAGLVSLSAMKRAIICAFCVSVLCGIYLIWQGGLWIALLLLLSIFLGVIYTYGPFSLAYLGLGDLFVFCFFGPIAVGFTYYLQTQTFSPEPFIVGIAPGCLSTVILMINNLRDVEEDRKAGKKTLAVRFGTGFVQCELVLALLLSILSPLVFYHKHPFTLLAEISLFPAAALAYSVFKAKDPLQYNSIFPKAGKLLFIYTFLFSIGWMI